MNIYTMDVFENALEGIENFDSENEIDLFDDEDFRQMLEEMKEEISNALGGNAKKAKKASKVVEDDDEEDEAPKKPAKKEAKPAAKKPAKVVEEEEEEEEELFDADPEEEGDEFDKMLS